MAHGPFVPLVEIADHPVKTCLEILRSSVISVTRICPCAGEIIARVRTPLLIFGAGDINVLLPNRIVEQFHEDVA